MKTVMHIILKAVIVFSLMASCAMNASAQKDPDDYHVILTLKDGSKVEGFINTALKNYLRPRISEISVSREFGGTEQKYTSDEVVSIVFPPNEKDTTTVVFHSVIAQSKLPNMLSKNPKSYKKPIFLRLVYDGDNVKGYAMPLFDRTFGQTITVLHYTWRYFYKTDSGDMAKAYWDDTDDVIPGMKKVMKLYFREFPELQNMVEDEQITPKAFRDNPTIVLPIMNELCSDI